MGDSYPKLRIGAVQAAPVFMNREATIAKACDLIGEAGRKGVQLLGFPEGFIPGHPQWYAFHPVASKKSLEMARELFKNSLVIPGPGVDALCQAARAAGVYVIMGCCEKDAGTMGTMYNTQFAIDQHGRLIGKRRKLVPTVGERLVHTGGDGDAVRVFDSEWGPIGALICGENENSLLRFSVQAMGARVHVASWPSFFGNRAYPMQDSVPFITRALAHECGVFVVNSVTSISDEMIELLPATDEDHDFLLQSAKRGGGAAVIGPEGEYLAGPLGEGEGIAFADVDLEAVVTHKMTMDFAGHYNRRDIFTLTINRSVRRYVNVETGRSDQGEQELFHVGERNLPEPDR